MSAAALVVPVRAARCGIRLDGTVQGLGVRPSVFRLATQLQLAGLVRNESGSVWIEVEGAEPSVQGFMARLEAALPPGARVDRVQTERLPLRAETVFRIEPSRLRAGLGTDLPPDLAPCIECLRELQDASDRRHRYPFINCTACGPRFTIVRALPYDRARTTMQAFEMCAQCRWEYDDPADRRFHAEPIACPDCGPTLAILGGTARGEQALRAAVDALHRGEILALKGVGGFALAVDATRHDAVVRLRERKRRPHKPLAVMARDLEHAERIAILDEASREALRDPQRPIVLLPAHPDSPLAPAIAPGLGQVGVFLPPTPLQHLLLADGPPWQVMTSGNVSNEPIARTDQDARARLDDVADLVLTHDREIKVRADDSVVRIVAGAPLLIRRARGFVPRSSGVPVEGPPVLAVGGQDKSVVCLLAGGRALLSPHLGELDHPETFAWFDETVNDLVTRMGVKPEVVVHDLHPDYRSSRWALQSGLPRIAVQHHHAHVAACLAEHQRTGPVIGVAFDGTGMGLDGTAWGGEFLTADLLRFERRGHLGLLALAGGEAAIREPWRLAAAAVSAATESLDLLSDQVDPPRLRAVERLLKKAYMPRASGAGRWFDAVAALCGLASEASYDGQAAVELEAAAADLSGPPYDFDIDGRPFEVDLRPVIRQIVADRRDGVAVPYIAARFHETLARVVQAGCVRLRAAGAPSTVVLTGGCFVNRRLSERCFALLQAEGFEVLMHRNVPPNDGGLCLGQAVVASATAALKREERPCVSAFPVK